MLRQLPRLLLLVSLLLLALPLTAPAATRAASLQPLIHLSVDTAHPGDSVTVTGEGFSPLEIVLVQLDNTTVTRAQASRSGTFLDATFPVSTTVTAGVHTVRAVGTFSGRTAIASLNVLVAPEAVLANGTLLRDASNGRVYLMWGGVRHWITSRAVFTALGYRFSDVLNRPHQQVVALPDGPGLALRQVKGVTYPLSPISSGAAQLTLSQPGAAPGASLTVLGSGFGANEAVQISFGSATAPITTTAPITATSLITTDTHGAFRATVTIPVTATVGTILPLVAYGPASGMLQVEPVSVTSASAAPRIGGIAASIPRGTPLQVSGSGFAAGEHIDLFLADGAAVGAVKADKSGSFVVHLTVPSSLAVGVHRLFAVGSQSKLYAEIPVNVTAPVQSVATIAVVPGSVHPGDQVLVSGSGFAPGDLIQITLNTVPVLSVHADVNGAFTQAPFVVPAGTTAGTYAVRAASTSSHLSASASLTVVALPTPVVLANGDLIRDTSNGRTYVMWGGVRHWITSSTTFDLLGYSRSAIRDLTHSFVVSIPEGAGLSVRQVHGLVYPLSPISSGSASLHVTPPAGAAGAQIALDGSGFAANETVQIAFAGNTSTVQAAANGSFHATVTMPSNAIGSRLRVYAFGLTSGVLQVEPLLVISAAPAPQVTLSASSIAQGDTLRVSGTGFAAGETVHLFLAGGESVATATANGGGAFSNVGIAVPSFLSAGQHSLLVFGAQSNLLAVGSVTVTQPAPPPATLTLSTTTANPGSLVLASGSGYAAGEQVTVQFAGKTVLVVTADGAGRFVNAGFTIPSSTTAGTYPVLATGAASHRQGVVGLTIIAFNPSVSVTPGSGTPGATVSVTGQGFAPGEVVTLALNGAALTTTPSVIKTSAGGTFSAGFIVPATALSGANTLAATGATSRGSATATLSVVLPVQSTWYFSGGSTQGSDSTQIALVNTNDQAAAVTFSFMFTSGAPVPYTTSVPAHSRATVDVGSVVGGGRTVFTMITSDRKIGAEQTIYRSGQDFSSTIGVSAPLKNWYLAEGYTGLTFHEYVRIFNPNTTTANTLLRLLPFNGRPAMAIPETVAPQSGLVVDINAIAPRQSLAAIVESDQPVVVDRLITFGAGGYGATEQMGSNTPSSTWFFAEGSTLNNFETFLTILNPSGSAQAVVTATFFDRLGNVLGNTTIAIDPLHRGNIQVANFVRSSGIATIITSNIPVFAERPLYFGAPNSTTAVAGGSDVFGRNGGGVSWLFPEGQTFGSYREFLLLQNPALLPANVRVRFYTASGQTVDYTLVVPAKSRATVDVLKDVPGLVPGQHSALVTTTNGVPIIAEQSIYSDNFTKGDGVAGIAQ